MPKTDKGGTARQNELPGTLQRSDRKAQETFAKAHDAAAAEYSDEERAHRVAYSALKHTHEKVGDRWEKKDKPGPSDSRAAGGRNSPASTAGGVDANASKAHLYEIAQRLDVPGRSSMSKPELVEAIRKANEQKTRKASE
ncbi:ChaB family protein [Paenarthrobacter sp. DKR-5]|uniref:ChaB family protein n=1 Tax=Paenarthrobacter sp. DKR-5 TaxID=2835535 RepID=UPI001BDDC1C9|nr:ChaB family protein [Paenarthrobacter sp. DKR-5]MBT1003599.1 ChaB family protein [Paenarthrobacter sp. DKR-5]